MTTFSAAAGEGLRALILPLTFGIGGIPLISPVTGCCPAARAIGPDVYAAERWL